MMNEEFPQKEILDELDPNQAEAVTALYNRIKDKSPNEILPIVMAFKMPKGKAISPEKRNKLIAFVMEQLGQSR